MGERIIAAGTDFLTRLLLVAADKKPTRDGYAYTGSGRSKSHATTKWVPAEFGSKKYPQRAKIGARDWHIRSCRVHVRAPASNIFGPVRQG